MDELNKYIILGAYQDFRKKTFSSVYLFLNNPLSHIYIYIYIYHFYDNNQQINTRIIKVIKMTNLQFSIEILYIYNSILKDFNYF